MNIQLHPDNTIPTGQWIWVFGSSESAKHNKGAAKIARVNFRAEYGCSQGPTGRAYAIPVEDKHHIALAFNEIAKSVEGFIDYAKSNPKMNFFVSRIGQAEGFSDEAIGALFASAPANCSLPQVWKEYLEESVATA